MSETPKHEHSAPDYYGRCEGCGIRLESPSRWMRDTAEREGGTIVHMSKTITLPKGVTPETFIAHLTANVEAAKAALGRKVLAHILGHTDPDLDDHAPQSERTQL